MNKLFTMCRFYLLLLSNIMFWSIEIFCIGNAVKITDILYNSWILVIGSLNSVSSF